MTSPALVIVPTYNERENIDLILDAILAESAADVLVIDDGSPDGTAELVRARTVLRGSRVHLLERPGKQGLGSAYVTGFRWGLDRGYSVLVEMDADGSHPVAVLQSMIDLVLRGSATLVIGSRWIPGGSVVDWPKRREFLSRGANTYARIMLGLSVHDSTAGYRAYSAELLRAIDLGSIDSHGYCFQIDMTVRSRDADAVIQEVPIAFRDRRFGTSKMSGSIILEAMGKVTLWGVERMLGVKKPASSTTPAA